MLIDETPPCVSPLRGRYAVLICSRQIGQGSATPQMAGQGLALREPPGRAMTALRCLTREPAIACAPRLVLTLPGGSDGSDN
jgi:hypothetical protein